MKAFWMVLVGNLHKRKMYSGIIMILSVLTTMFLVSAVSIVMKTSTIYEASYDRAGEADLFYGFVSNKQLTEYENFFKEREETEEVYWEDSFIGTIHSIEDENQPTIFSVFGQKERNYTTIPADIAMLEQNEILLPLCFEEDYEVAVGDTFYYEDTEYIIKGFFEDPVYGTPFYAYKRVFISEEAFEELKALWEGGKYEQLQPLKFIHIDLGKEYQGEKLETAIKELDGAFEGRGQSMFAFDKANLQTVRTIVPRIILIILFVFALFLMSIMVIVIRYTILAAIEDDYSTLGIMKALGFRNRNLTMVLLGQYLSVVLAGTLIGIGIAYFITPYIGTFLLETSGIVWLGTIEPKMTAWVVALLLLFISGLILMQTGRVKKVSPIEAITKDRRANENRKNHFVMTQDRVERFPLAFKMGVKQISSNIVQYISMLLLVTIFSFMILTVISLSNAFGTDEKISGILGYEINDISIEFSENHPIEEGELEQIFWEIDNDYGITYLSSFNDRHKVYSENMQIQLLVNSEFDGSNLIEGRLPSNQDEIMISSGISSILQKQIGDTVEISLEKESETQSYTVVGINNKVHSMGKNISMTEDGFVRLKESYSPTQYYIKLKHAEEVEAAIQDISTQYAKDYPDISITNERETILRRTQAINLVFRMISILIIVISLFLIGLITFLVSLVVMKRETYHFGIMKSIGFTSGQIRIQFAIRFALIACMGALIGMTVYAASNNRLINGLFSIVNIAGIPAGTTISSYAFDMTFIVLTASACAWLVSRKIKQVQVKDLITE